MAERRDSLIGREARRLLGALDRRGDLERARAVSAWEQVAGPDVARHAAGYAMRGPELVVFTDTAVWASELSALSESYRTAVNEQLGREMVTSIRFTVSKDARKRGLPADEGDEGGAARSAEKAEPVPLSADEEKTLEGMAGGIHDERLKAAAMSAAKRHLEWRKGVEKGRRD